ncbi:GNAT family N-acetyltransferase [Jeongeupia chitinilytica]|uniref:N-acetyltransferase n=1 Tax=Jeongeupia chitinilytica TaxID=1041641 RepID=A0ABQ3GWL4_9NEIS|nr:GNAT family N-acetyltransferase [Jeongeupia chitinilytica]GHD57112.1 N-acetyltransferase [Jeongeupia chitinilytica]
METIYTLTENHVTQLHELYQQESWTQGRSLEDTKKVVNGSQICIGLINEANDLVGFARVITDYTFKAMILDVIVRNQERGKGLGGKLLSTIKEHSQLVAVKHIELYCRPELLGFYSRHGFSTAIPMQLMRVSNA